MMNKRIISELILLCRNRSKKKGLCSIAFERDGVTLCRATDALNKGIKTCEYQTDIVKLDFDIHGKEMFGYWVCEKK